MEDETPNREVHLSSSSFAPSDSYDLKEQRKKQSNKVYRDSMKEYVKFLENKIDQDLGFYFWKRYTAAAFWTQISTPINLLITLMTALTTAQSASSNILQQEAYQKVAIATLIITTLNTFFRPHIQLTYNTEQLQKWNEIGIEFENVYYSNRDIDTLTIEQIEYKVSQYKESQIQLNSQRKAEGVGAINFITDIFHLVAMRTCIRKYKRWLDRDRQIQKKAKQVEDDEKKKQTITKNVKNQDVLVEKKIEGDFKIQIDTLNLHQKAQEAKIQQLEELLSFAKSPKCLTNTPSSSSANMIVTYRSRSNTPITPTSTSSSNSENDSSSIKGTCI
jgi:hypothetical protein